MTAVSRSAELSAPGWPRYLFLATAVLAYLLITMGGVVCMTESGRGCPDWPGCYGQIVPPPRTDAIIEFTHRYLAALTTPFIVASALVAWRRFPALPWVKRPLLLAILFTLAVVVFGAFAVLTGLPRGLAAVDVASALTVLALVVASTVAAFWHHAQPTSVARPSFRAPFARLTVWAAAAVLAILVSGVLVAYPGSAVRCLGLPFYGGGSPADTLGWLQLGRRLLGLAALALVAAVVVQAWRTQRSRTGLPAIATVVAALSLAGTVVGLLPAGTGLPAWLLVLHSAMTVAIWGLLVALAMLAGLAAPAVAPARSRSAALAKA